MPQLPPAFELVRDGGATGVPIGDTLVALGRDARNTVVVDHPRVSAFHARIWSDGRQVWIADAGSTHGTRVNGDALVRAHPLGPGDRVELADGAVFTVRRSIGAPTTRWLLEDVDAGLRVSPRSYWLDGVQHPVPDAYTDVPFDVATPWLGVYADSDFSPADEERATVDDIIVSNLNL